MRDIKDLVRVRYQREIDANTRIWSSVSIDGALFDAFADVVNGDRALARARIREIAEELSHSADKRVDAGLSRRVQRAVLKMVLENR